MGARKKAARGGRRPWKDGGEPRSGKRRPRQLSETKLQELRRRLPGIDSLLVFFLNAGIPAHLVQGGRLRIGGRLTPPLDQILPRAEKRDWDKVIDAVVMRYAGGKFVTAITDNARFGEGLRAFPRRSERGFAIMRGDVQLATLHATCARIHHETIYANFLTPGIHWQQVADTLRSAEPELVAAWQREQQAGPVPAPIGTSDAQATHTGTRRLDRLPEHLHPELISACHEASRRIRLERQVAYDRPVVLECDLGELMLLPVTGTRHQLLMPFQLTSSRQTLKGKIVLESQDPLPLLTSRDVTDQDAIAGWTCALLGIADATCIEIRHTSPVGRHEPPKPRPDSPGTAHQQRSSAPALPRKQYWPTHLQPIGHWARHSGSLVAGHRRRLNDGQAASTDARDRALRVGIALRPHETWVQPHTRGLPDDIEMRFAWQAPAELKLTLTNEGSPLHASTPPEDRASSGQGGGVGLDVTALIGAASDPLRPVQLGCRLVRHRRRPLTRDRIRSSSWLSWPATRWASRACAGYSTNSINKPALVSLLSTPLHILTALIRTRREPTSPGPEDPAPTMSAGGRTVRTRMLVLAWLAALAAPGARGHGDPRPAAEVTTYRRQVAWFGPGQPPDSLGPRMEVHHRVVERLTRAGMSGQSRQA